MSRRYLHLYMLIAFFFTVSMGFARDFVIYSIVQDFPMSKAETNPKKNFYLNIGKQQGVKEGTSLNVFRNVSRVDPYQTKKRYNYKVKIGKLKVLHSEDENSIARVDQVFSGIDTPLFEIRNFMIGDQVDIAMGD